MSAEAPRIELATRAVRDLRRLAVPERRRVHQALVALAVGAENADVKALAAAAPWLHLRVGEWRVLYRPLSDQEAAHGGPGLIVARVVNRRDVLRAVRALGS